MLFAVIVGREHALQRPYMFARNSDLLDVRHPYLEHVESATRHLGHRAVTQHNQVTLLIQYPPTCSVHEATDASCLLVGVTQIRV